MERMVEENIDEVKSTSLSVKYIAPRTVMQLDSNALRQENEELYSRYCKPKQRRGYIVVKHNKAE